ncbi:MAG TPA: SGNH/GDSL hydrolase family protein [Acidobacteriaceae bacterium]|nr:SGNH/GDSL hydrolase family protein [Acidobacteriaceae bacterium]
MALTIRRPALHFLASLLLIPFIASTSASASSNSDAHWVGTWSSSPVSATNGNSRFSDDTTLREIVHVSIGGSSVRIVLSNAFGPTTLRIGGANVALAAAAGAIKGTAVPALFHGQPTVEIPAGAEVVSDPIALDLPPLSDLAVTIFVPGQTIATITQHGFADATNYELAGNQLASSDFAGATTLRSWPFLKAVEVLAPANAAAIVAFGDSITDGAHSTADKNMRWPDVFARRLQADKKTAHLAVLNEGIGGNHILDDSPGGQNALARFDRDVLDQSGVKYLIILEGINDIGHAYGPDKPDNPITAGQLEMALAQLVDRAHAHGIKVFGATLTPYVGAKYASPEGEKVREAENDFILHSGKFDGVIDFAKATADPADPTRFAATAGSADNLHPGDSGYQLMGDSIDLKLFKK